MLQKEIPESELGYFPTLVSIVERLRAPGGCPWDREQTHASLKRNLLEECYEVLEAIDRGDSGPLAEELGDLLVEIAAELGNARPTPKWVRPRRSLSLRVFGRDSSNLDLLAGEANRLLSGGVYFLEPSYLLGDYLNSQ